MSISQDAQSPLDAQSQSITAPIIGYHRSPLSQKFGIPRQPNLVSVPSYIDMIAPYNTPDAFHGITAFSHLWITWHTHHNRSLQNKNHTNQVQSAFKPKVRPPRLGGNKKLGVFATRSTYRPSQLGLSVVKLSEIQVTDTGILVHIIGADMVDGTPIIDIKPYISYSDAITHSTGHLTPNHSNESLHTDTNNKSLQKPISKPIRISEQAQGQFDAFITELSNRNINANIQIKNPSLNTYSTNYLTYNDIDIICQLIAQDPRPAYHQHNTQRVFIMRYKHYDIHFKMNTDYEMVIVSVIALV